jgi:hypothetical protein
MELWSRPRDFVMNKDSDFVSAVCITDRPFDHGTDTDILIYAYRLDRLLGWFVDAETWCWDCDPNQCRQSNQPLALRLRRYSNPSFLCRGCLRTLIRGDQREWFFPSRPLCRLSAVGVIILYGFFRVSRPARTVSLSFARAPVLPPSVDCSSFVENGWLNQRRALTVCDWRDCVT